MENFIRNNFKFVFTIIWLTLLLIRLDNSRTFLNEFITDDIRSNHKIAMLEFEELKNKFDSFEKKIISEFGYSRAIEYVTFEELIKCMNYHAGCSNKIIEERRKKDENESDLIKSILNKSPAN